MLSQGAFAGVIVATAVAGIIVGVILTVIFALTRGSNVRKVQPQENVFQMSAFDESILKRLEMATTDGAVISPVNSWETSGLAKKMVSFMLACQSLAWSMAVRAEDLETYGPSFVDGIDGDTELWIPQLLNPKSQNDTIAALIARFFYARMGVDGDIDQLILPAPFLQLNRLMKQHPSNEQFEIMDRLRQWWATLTCHYLREYYVPEAFHIRDKWTKEGVLYVNFDKIEQEFLNHFDPLIRRYNSESTLDPNEAKADLMDSLHNAMSGALAVALSIFASQYPLEFAWPEPCLSLPKRFITMSPKVWCRGVHVGVEAMLSDSFFNKDFEYVKEEFEKIKEHGTWSQVPKKHTK